MCSVTNLAEIFSHDGSTVLVMCWDHGPQQQPHYAFTTSLKGITKHSSTTWQINSMTEHWHMVKIHDMSTHPHTHTWRMHTRESRRTLMQSWTPTHRQTCAHLRERALNLKFFLRWSGRHSRQTASARASQSSDGSEHSAPRSHSLSSILMLITAGLIHL